MVVNLLLRSLLPTRVAPNLLRPTTLIDYVQCRGAARKGKRIARAREARLRANKRRLLEAQNPKPKKQHKSNLKVDKNALRFFSERHLDATLPNPPDDNVYFSEGFRRPRYSFDEIVEFHRQLNHPDVFNSPDALLTATVELNVLMKIKKKKHIDNLASTVCYPHKFQYDVRERKIVALCKNEEDQEAARQAGAIMAGAADIAQLLKTQQLTLRDFDHLVCHTDFLVEFAAVKGMKGSPFFPNKQRANFGPNIVELVKFFRDGVDYKMIKKQDGPEYGIIECYFGRLNMTNEQLRENLNALFHSINRFKPLNLIDGKQFFHRVLITTPNTEEIFALKFWDMFEEYDDPDDVEAEYQELKKAQV